MYRFTEQAGFIHHHLQVVPAIDTAETRERRAATSRAFEHAKTMVGRVTVESAVAQEVMAKTKSFFIANRLEFDFDDTPPLERTAEMRTALTHATDRCFQDIVSALHERLREDRLASAPATGDPRLGNPTGRRDFGSELPIAQSLHALGTPPPQVNKSATPFVAPRPRPQPRTAVRTDDGVHTDNVFSVPRPAALFGGSSSQTSVFSVPPPATPFGQHSWPDNIFSTPPPAVPPPNRIFSAPRPTPTFVEGSSRHPSAGSANALFAVPRPAIAEPMHLGQSSNARAPGSSDRGPFNVARPKVSSNEPSDAEMEE